MNRTNLEHAFYAALIQFAFAILLRGVFDGAEWWIGAAVAGGFFLGREHAQREYHIGDPSTLNPLAAFDFVDWGRDSLLDLLCPLAVVVVVAIVATLY